MSYTIEKYYLKKIGKKQYVVKAKIIKRNWLGAITDIRKETLNGDYKCSHEVSYMRPHHRNSQLPISKHKAKIIIEILNKISVCV